MKPQALLLLLLVPPAGSPEPVVRRADRTDAATLELARAYPATVRLPGGSGTLIAPRWVLTAAHVARDLSPFAPPVRVGGFETTAVRSLFHPDSESRDGLPPRHDLALVELADPVEGVEPVTLHRGSDEVGRPVVVVGFGDFAAGDGPLQPADGRARAVTNVVERLEHGHLALDLDAGDGATELEGIGAPGDSGGPLYLETEQGLRLAGVSFASIGEGGVHELLDLYVRVSEVAGWIDEARASAPPAEDPEALSLADGFPEGPRGQLCSAFFEVFALGGEALEDFARDLRASESARRNPPAVFARRVERLRGDVGGLRPERLAPLSPERWVVLAEGRDGWHAVDLRLVEEGGDVRLADFAVREELPPR